MRMARMNDVKPKLSKTNVARIASALFGLLIAGCAHHREFSGTEPRALATPPAFLTGPMALLLTNANSYTAQQIFETRTAWGFTQAGRWEVMSTGSKLAVQHGF